MSSPAEAVRSRVALADRLRRKREASRRLWRAAPIAAAGCALLAAGVRWSGLSPVVPVIALAVAGIVLTAYTFASTRARAVSEAGTAAIDARAGLGGELRSASWFAARDAEDPWIAFHLSRAAERVNAVDWAQLYPARPAARAKAATLALAAGTVILALVIPGRTRLDASARLPRAGASHAHALAPSAEQAALAADIQKQLDELLKNAESGGASSGIGRTLTAAEVRDLLSRLGDLEKLRDAKDAAPDAKTAADPTATAMKGLEASAERARRDAAMSSLAPEVRDALSDVADKLAEMAEQTAAAPKDAQETAAAGEAAKGNGAQKKEGGKQEAAVQSVKDASAGGGIGVVTMASDDQQSTEDPGLGLGGSGAAHNGGGKMADIGPALRKETIEAHADGEGENLETELRRQTEHADATVGYAHTAAGRADRGRAVAPPAVPESRRTALHNYFIRKQ